MTDEKKATELVADLKTADKADAQAVLEAEQAKGDGARSTVVAAATERLAALDVPGDVVTTTPSGHWGQLLDGDTGEPVLVDGSPVSVPLTP